MSRKVQFGFLLELVSLPLDSLVPTKPISKERRASEMYKKVVASVKAEGLSEAPVVTRDGRSSRYFILDGHVRVEALKDAGIAEVLCLISTDDEGYTYNQCVSRISLVALAMETYAEKPSHIRIPRKSPRSLLAASALRESCTS